MKKTSRRPRIAKISTGVTPTSASESQPSCPAAAGLRSAAILASQAPAPPSSSQVDRIRAMTNSLP